MKLKILQFLILLACATPCCEAASAQFYRDYNIADNDLDGFMGEWAETTDPVFEIPSDFDDHNFQTNPDAFDNPSPRNENDTDDDQDGVIDGEFVGPLTFAEIPNLQINAGQSFAISLNISGINSPDSLFLQAYAAGSVFNPFARTLSWTSQAGDAGQTYLFSIVAAAQSGNTIIQRQFSVTVVSPPITPYASWASGFGLNPLTDGAPGFDKDDDTQSNLLEFATGGKPTDGSDMPKVHGFVADSSADVDSSGELLLTIAVRAGAPAFVGFPSPAAMIDGVTYSV